MFERLLASLFPVALCGFVGSAILLMAGSVVRDPEMGNIRLSDRGERIMGRCEAACLYVYLVSLVLTFVTAVFYCAPYP